MTAMMDCSQARLSLGVYVLGAIDRAERVQVESHLAGCRACRDELAGLAELPALLARVSPEEAIALAASDPRPAWEEEVLEPPDRLVATVLDLTAARRRRRRWRESVFGVAAALVIAAGVFGGLRMSAAPTNPYPHGPAGQWQSASGQSHGMAAWVDYRPMSWGTELEAKVSGIPNGTTCQIWLVAAGKTRTLAGSWTVHAGEGDIWYPSSAAMPAGQVQKFVITVGKDRSITVDS
jgi:hypothetical protein